MSPTSMVTSLGSPVVQNLQYPHINIDPTLVLKDKKKKPEKNIVRLYQLQKPANTFTGHIYTSQLNSIKNFFLISLKSPNVKGVGYQIAGTPP